MEPDVADEVSEAEMNEVVLHSSAYYGFAKGEAFASSTPCIE